MTETYRFRAVLTDEGWKEGTCVTVDASGSIVSIGAAEKWDESFDAFVVPGFKNSHSHAFQYGMAGLAERQIPGMEADDFWNWRENMYRLALEVDPEDVKAIAAMLYSEMLSKGFTSVVEFHYLHHDKDGTPYSNLAAMGEAVVEAAKETGIRITLTPVYYRLGGFGRPATDRQRRFLSKSTDDYLKLVEASRKACESYEHARLGVGVHSLRAVSTSDFLETVSSTPDDIPFHLHASEQIREVDECVEHLGARPVEWLLDNTALDRRFNLVHATHMTEDETVRLARSGANAVLCPSTEASLGDGIFPLRSYVAARGTWSIGTDSHIGIDPFEELRLLDSFQRLISHRRDTFPGDPGRYAIESSLKGGASATGESARGLAVGQPFDACLVDATSPLLAECRPEDRASTMVFASGATKIVGVFVSGHPIKPTQSVRIQGEFLKRIRTFRSS